MFIMSSRQTIKRTAKVCFDILLFLLVWSADFFIRKWMTPFQRGFFCGDESLSYPFKENTITLGVMALIVFAVPPLVILAVELFKHLGSHPSSSGSPHAHRKSVSPGSGGGNGGNNNVAGVKTSNGCRIGYRLIQCYKQIGYYLFGLGLVLIATEIPKFGVGRLRPNFFAVCQPLIDDGTTCDDDINQGRYITNFTCVSSFTDKMKQEIRQSFPSGHSSIFAYSMLYLAIYLQAALSTRASKLLKHILQFIFVMFAVYVAMTRISDYWHHWSDVLSGFTLGTIVAIVVARYVSDLFEHHRGGRIIGTYRTAIHKTVNSSGSSKSGTTTAPLPAYTFGTMPYLHYPAHHAQYSHATYQNYGYVP